MYYLKIVSNIVFFLLVISVVYVLSLYVILFRNGVFYTYKRISFKVIKDAINANENKDYLKQLLHLKIVYTISVFLFWTLMILFVTSIYQSNSGVTK